MTRQLKSTPGSEVPGADQERRLGDAGNNVIAMRDYTTSATPRTTQHLYPRLVARLRCGQCPAGYFDPGALALQSCPACTGGRVPPVERWDLCSEAATVSMLRRGEAA